MNDNIYRMYYLIFIIIIYTLIFINFDHRKKFIKFNMFLIKSLLILFSIRKNIIEMNYFIILLVRQISLQHFLSL